VTDPGEGTTTASEPTDDELMARGAEGDEEAFRLLVRRWEAPVFAFLERMLGSPEEAQDLAQETFLRIGRQARSYRPEGRFKSWLFRIAGNLARSRLRRRKILTWVRFEPGRHDRAERSEPADERLEREERRQAVRAALARLPERQRRAVVLRRWENMSLARIAETMDTTVSAVESLLHRATETLRRDLGRRREIL
jgi:RNA polymerase sigma-70 factor (ECF subfamily)